MNSSTKITLRSQSGSGSKHAFQKVPVMVRTIFKLALVNAFDEEGRIRNSKGEFIPNTNLVDLLALAMTPRKDIYGIDEFVDRLAEARADPVWFSNEHVSRLLTEKLIKVPKLAQPSLPPSAIQPLISTPPTATPTQLSPAPARPTTLNPVSSGAYWGPDEAKKRKLASFTKPPPLKIRPITYTPPSSPPSPFNKNMGQIFSKPEIPELDRMDGPARSPPDEMPSIDRMDTNDPQKQKRKLVDDDVDLPNAKRARVDDNKSEDAWLNPPTDDSDDDW